MKSSWKKKLNNEFDAAAPALKNDVLNAPIITAPEEATDAINGDVLIKRKIGIFTSCGAAILLAIVFVLMAIFGVFGSGSVADRFVFALEINPAVSFVTDKDGIVQSVNAVNEDADIVLSDETTLNRLKNAPLRDAVVTYTDCAARLGFLDMSAKTAVRLSCAAETDGDLLEGASENLRSYFKTNGVYAAVVEDVISVNRLGERLGVKHVSNMTELASAFETLPVRYGERIGENASAEELQNLYQNYIVGTQMLDYVRGELLQNINDIVSNAQMLSQIGLCNYNIMMHKDNPFNPIPVDYWTVKKFPNAQYTPEFAALTEEMSGLLEEYKSKFGVSIDSVTKLTLASDAYSSLSGVDFEKLFSSLTAESFQASAARFVEMLKNIGGDVTALESLLSVPQTTQEYFAQLQTISQQLFDSRVEQYKEIYEHQRAEISEAEYHEFINEIMQEYGSLDNFWSQK